MVFFRRSFGCLTKVRKLVTVAGPPSEYSSAVITVEFAAEYFARSKDTSLDLIVHFMMIQMTVYCRCTKKSLPAKAFAGNENDSSLLRVCDFCFSSLKEAVEQAGGSDALFRQGLVMVLSNSKTCSNEGAEPIFLRAYRLKVRWTA